MSTDRTPFVPFNFSVDSGEVLIRKVAEVGASLCSYLPGAGNPDEWPTSRCDCKFGASGKGEQTGCCEARTIYWMLTQDERASRK